MWTNTRELDLSPVSGNEARVQVTLVHDNILTFIGEYPIHPVPNEVRTETGAPCFPPGEPSEKCSIMDVSSAEKHLANDRTKQEPMLENSSVEHLVDFTNLCSDASTNLHAAHTSRIDLAVDLLPVRTHRYIQNPGSNDNATSQRRSRCITPFVLRHSQHMSPTVYNVLLPMNKKSSSENHTNVELAPCEGLSPHKSEERELNKMDADVPLQVNKPLKIRHYKRYPPPKPTDQITRSGRISKIVQSYCPPLQSKKKKIQRQQEKEHTEQDADPKQDEGLKRDEQMAAGSPIRVPREQKIPSSNRCATCFKIYRGSRMTVHLNQNPTHITMAMLDTIRSIRLYDLLMLRVKNVTPESEQRAVLLHEISQFVQQIRSLGPCFIATSDQGGDDVAYVDQHVAEVLQINRGKYRFCIDAFEQKSGRLHGSGGANSASETIPTATAEQLVPNEIEPAIDQLLKSLLDLEEQQKLGTLHPISPPLQLLIQKWEESKDLGAANAQTSAINEPEASSSNHNIAFGRPFTLPEELLPSNEGLFDLSELNLSQELMTCE